MKRLFSGIQPSGDLHIGNYLGAIRNWVRLVDKYESIFCVVDLHAITIEYDPEGMQKRVMSAVANNIACGLDPEKCTLFIQSHVPEHCELQWILNTVTPMGELERMTQFKDKAKQHSTNINSGLLNYPILMAADILLYKAQAVPVGDDQIQHLELSREIARRFNSRFGDYFPEPQPLLSETPRIMGLDGKSKMSKSLGNTISLIDPPEVVQKKLATAVTDENRKRRKDPGNPDICNIYTMHKSLSTTEQLSWVEKGCRSAGIGCVECKKVLAENMIAELTPIREKAISLMEDQSYIKDVVNEGAKKCKAIAEETMAGAYGCMGLR